MLKARADDNLIFGLSAKNIDYLRLGHPITIDLRDLGFEGGNVIIYYGHTNEQLKQYLVDAGIELPAEGST